MLARTTSLSVQWRWPVFLIAVSIISSSCRGPADPLPGFPPLVLWAWERPENLSYIRPNATGVAFLAETITLRSGAFQCHPRMQPLWIPPATPLIAVVRIESRDPNRPNLNLVAADIAHTASRTPVRGLQIDFDARASERSYYRDLMVELRRKLPSNVALEMTALVSWCQAGDWLRGIPVSEAVPMFFRMGADPHSPAEHLRDPLCTSSIGISTDEFYVTIPQRRRVFVFSSRPWTESKYQALLRASKKWFRHS